MRRLAPYLSKLVSPSPRKRRDLARAQLAVLWAQLAVWIRPHGRLVRFDAAPLDPPDEHASLTARRLASAVAFVSRRGVFRPRCLVRSLALTRLLEREPVTGWRMCIGVRDRAGRFEAHAWVELGPDVLDDSSEHVASFERLTEVRMMRAR